MILESHSHLIDELIPHFTANNFDYMFDMLLLKEPKWIQFLIKMEIERRTALCNRTIDFREKSDLPCESTFINKREHFLDEVSKEQLFALMAIYQDNFTIGIYEKIIESHETIKSQQKKKQTNKSKNTVPFVIPAIELGCILHRQNEQINYNLKVVIRQQLQPDAKGIMTETSINAGIIRLPLNHKFDLEKSLFIDFNYLGDIANKLDLTSLKKPVEYSVFQSKISKQYVVSRVNRITKGKDISNALYQLAQMCKQGYKTDFDKAYQAILGFALERIYLSQYPHLAIFINKKNKQYNCSHVLKSQRNNGIYNYLIDEERNSQIEGLLTPTRLNKLIENPNDNENKLIFCFAHKVKGHTLFYSATLKELKQNNHQGSFFGFAAQKPSWRVYQLHLHTIIHPKSYKNSVLPGQKEKFVAKTEACLAGFSHFIEIVDCTNVEAKKNYMHWSEKPNPNDLKNYGQPNITKVSTQLISMKYFNRVQESRYELHTLVKLEQGKLRVESVSEDISSKGFQVKLNNFVQFNPDDIIYVSLPRLQHLSNPVPLKDLPYKIVNVRNNGMILHLMASIDSDIHIGVEFIKKLIQNNQKVLNTTSEEENELKQLTDGLKNLLLKQPISLPFFIQKDEELAHLFAVATGKEKCKLSQLFTTNKDTFEQFNLENLFNDNDMNFNTDIVNEIKSMDASMNMTYYEVFLTVSHQPFKMEFYESSKVGEYQEQLKFIRHSKKQGQFIALKIYRGVAPRPDFSHIQKELQYLSFYDFKASQNLQKNLKLIFGVGEIMDITAEVEMRFVELSTNENLDSNSKTKQEPAAIGS